MSLLNLAEVPINYRGIEQKEGVDPIQNPDFLLEKC